MVVRGDECGLKDECSLESGTASSSSSSSRHETPRTTIHLRERRA
jgi:hypothetical protein